jgi:hypothetical protein
VNRRRAGIHKEQENTRAIEVAKTHANDARLKNRPLPPGKNNTKTRESIQYDPARTADDTSSIGTCEPRQEDPTQNTVGATTNETLARSDKILDPVHVVFLFDLEILPNVVADGTKDATPDSNN